MTTNRHLIHLLFCSITCTILFACQPIDTRTQEYPVQINVSLPSLTDTTMQQTATINELKVVLNDLNMGKQHTIIPQDYVHNDTCLRMRIDAPAGYYDADISVTILIDSLPVKLQAYIKSISLSSSTADTLLILSTAAIVVQETSQDFIFAELSTSGTQTPQGKSYVGDSYFVLYNNTTDTLYADGVVLLESKLKNTQKYQTLTPNFIPDYFGTDAIYRIPGSGHDYPVAPGATVLLADNAQDHRKANPLSFDLSHADFEWYDQSTSASVTDIDNPDVPNMHKVYCYTMTIWLPNRQGNTSFAIARFPENLTDSAFLADYRLTYDYLLITSAGNFDMSATCYIVPNAWILDCVNTCPRTAYQWTVVSPSLDAGWTYIGEIGADKQRFGKCMRRREQTVNGRRILQDTNNSSIDFLPAQTPDPNYFNN